MKYRNSAKRTGALMRAAYWLCLLLLLVIGHSSNSLNSDEGLVLHGAWSLWNGQEPYTDFFQFIAPGSFYLVFWLWKLFGPSYLAAKSVAILSIFFSCLGIHAIGGLLARNKFSYVGPALYALSSFGWPAINHHTFNIALLIWAIYLFARSLGTASISAIAASGLTAGLSALFLQHKSAAVILVTAATLVCIWFRAKGRVWMMGLGVYLLCVAAPLLVMLHWEVGVLFADLIQFPMTRYIPHAKVPLWPFYFAAALLLGSVLLLRSAANRVTTYLLAIQAALLLMSLQRTDFMHVSIICAPLLALLPYLYVQTVDAPYLTRLLFRLVFVFVAAVPATLAALILVNKDHFTLDPAPELMGFVRERCAASPYLHAGPFLPGMYYETRKLDATPFPFLLTGFHTNEQFARAKVDLKQRRPACAVTSYATASKFNYDRDNPVDNFIKDHYRVAYTYGTIEVHVWDR